MLQLINGDVQAVINDTPVTQAYISKQEGKIKIVGDKIEADALMHSRGTEGQFGTSREDQRGSEESSGRRNL